MGLRRCPPRARAGPGHAQHRQTRGGGGVPLRRAGLILRHLQPGQGDGQAVHAAVRGQDVPVRRAQDGAREVNLRAVNS